MSILTSLFTGASGLGAHGDAIGVVGDNIANSSTVGFRAARASFADVLGGSAPSTQRYGAGVRMTGPQTRFTQGSLQQTVARAQRLIGQRQVSFQIDPQAFDRFGVSVAPTFVLLKSGSTATPCAAGACFAASSFALVAGDVSLDYALEFFRRSAPAFRREATGLLSKLKGGT